MLTRKRGWLRAGQVATRLGISPTRVNQLRASGVLLGLRTPLGFLFEEEVVERLQLERKAWTTARNAEVTRAP